MKGQPVYVHPLAPVGIVDLDIPPVLAGPDLIFDPKKVSVDEHKYPMAMATARGLANPENRIACNGCKKTIGYNEDGFWQWSSIVLATDHPCRILALLCERCAGEYCETLGWLPSDE